MYSNYSSYPVSSMSSSYMPVSSSSSIPMNYSSDDRFIGGFAAPFLLGGITGGLLAPAFYRPYPNYGPPYRPYPRPPYRPYPYYGPYYR